MQDWEAALAPHYEEAKRMLGATEIPFETDADLAQLAASADGDGSLDPQAERRQLFQAIYEALRPEQGQTQGERLTHTRNRADDLSLPL